MERCGCTYALFAGWHVFKVRAYEAGDQAGQLGRAAEVASHVVFNNLSAAAAAEAVMCLKYRAQQSLAALP